MKIDLDAIVQHYEFSTNYLDVTKDLNVALFFAYTQYINGKYYPIDDFEKSGYRPVLYVTSFGLMKLKEILLPVGFQGVARPQHQLAMALKVEDFDDNPVSYFTKIELPCSSQIFHGIYNSFNKGGALFPKDPIYNMRISILDSKLLREDLFEQYCPKYNQNKKDLLSMLNAQGYFVKNWEIPFDIELETNITKDIHENLIPWIKENVSYRYILTVTFKMEIYHFNCENIYV